MKKSIGQDTLQALIETAAAREFRARRGGLDAGHPPRRYLAARALAARTRAYLGQLDRCRALRFRGRDSRTQRRAVNP